MIQDLIIELESWRIHQPLSKRAEATELVDEVIGFLLKRTKPENKDD